MEHSPGHNNNNGLAGLKQGRESGSKGDWVGRREGSVLSMHRLTGTNLLYHLLGDLMVDDDWTERESGRDVNVSKNFLLIQNSGAKCCKKTRLSKNINFET